MVETTYKIDGMSCGSCAMKIEKVVSAINGIQSARVAFKARTLSIASEKEIDRRLIIGALLSVGDYSLKDAVEEREQDIYSILVWGILGAIFIAGLFYLLQALGMQSWTTPIEFMTDNWYFVVPLIFGFGTQMGLFRAIHLLAKHGGGGIMAGSGGISGAAMLACCTHNLVPLFPVLGAGGLAIFFTAYQTQVFLFSIGVTLLGVGYMLWKYYSIKSACETRHNKQ